MSSTQRPILLADGDPGILTTVGQALTAQGYEVTTATNGTEVLDAFEHKPPELILLDLLLPRCDGEEVCHYIRQHSKTPIIVLSIKDSEADVVSLLDLGVDDYLVKPFRLAELLARVRAVLRRVGRLPATRVVCGALEIDVGKHRVTVAGRIVSLTPIEYALLTELAVDVDRVSTTRLLLQRVWGLQCNRADYVKVVVRRLRAKLEPDPAHPQYILTEPHLGYRLNPVPLNPDDATPGVESHTCSGLASSGFGEKNAILSNTNVNTRFHQSPEAMKEEKASVAEETTEAIEKLARLDKEHDGDIILADYLSYQAAFRVQPYIRHQPSEKVAFLEELDRRVKTYIRAYQQHTPDGKDDCSNRSSSFQNGQHTQPRW